jgi:hypothetical protein
MSRWLAVAALGAAFITLPAWGQHHGGGGGGFGGHAGFASHGGGFGGGMSGGHSFGFSGGARAGGFHSAGNFGGSHFAGPRFGSGFHRPFGFQHPGFVRRYPRYGYVYGYPYYGYPYYGYPGYYDDSDEPYDYTGSAYSGNDYGSDDASERQQAEVDRLEGEVNSLRQERNSATRTVTKPRNDLDSLTELVFRDQHTQEVQNYAIVGQTFWIFDNQMATKIPLAALDIPATKKANDERGVDFQIPE